MPASLPPHPNLEHLKKQAKALLRAFRRNDPEAVEAFGTLRLKGTPTLSDAQHLVARTYGFRTWSEMKAHVEAAAQISEEVLQQARQAFREDDAPALRRLLAQYPALKASIQGPIEGLEGPLINSVRSPEMLDVLLDAGADVNARSDWWAGGFGLLDGANPEVAARAIERGAVVTVHAAARLGMLDKLKALIAEDPERVHARGGDGQTPLHFASTVEVADFLLKHGADIDARDVDHASTPTQYMVRTRQDVARYLIGRGCTTDLLMAAALGDEDLALKHLAADPACIRMRVSDEHFPMVGGSNGGTIYQWELGWYVSAPQVARAFGHVDLFRLLMERCPADEKLLNACWLHDETMVHALLVGNPDLARSLPPAGRRHVAHAARNDDTAAARLMLEADLPVAGVFSQHHATPLHWASWHGNVELVRLLLRRHPPLEDTDNDYGSTPLGWALHGSEHGWHRDRGDYPATVEVLLDAGARPPEKPEGTDAVQAVLRRRSMQ